MAHLPLPPMPVTLWMAHLPLPPMPVTLWMSPPTFTTYASYFMNVTTYLYHLCQLLYEWPTYLYHLCQLLYECHRLPLPPMPITLWMSPPTFTTYASYFMNVTAYLYHLCQLLYECHCLPLPPMPVTLWIPTTFYYLKEASFLSPNLAHRIITCSILISVLFRLDWYCSDIGYKSEFRKILG